MTNVSTDDTHINRVIELMHSKDESSFEELHKLLEEVILKKYGNTRSLDNIRFKREVVPVAIETPIVSASAVPAKRRSQDDSGRNSDNELVFTLLKDDLTCVTCRDMDVSAGNQLIECNSCHALYHQECHTPYILDSELNTNWICSTCKYRARKASKHSSSGSSGRNNGGSGGSASGSERHSSSTSASKSGSSSSSYSKISSGSPSNTSSGGGHSTSKHYSGTNKNSSHSSSDSSTTHSTHSSGSKSPSSNSTQNNQRIVVPNINIVSASADKRLQIMKRKAAAKIQEKRKPKPLT